jgi:hypothetical protein
MAKKNKSSQRNGRFLRKVHQLTETDIFTSIAIVSLLLNILFFASIFVLSSTDTFDRGLYKTVKSQYCNNLVGLENRAIELGSENDALQEWRIECRTSEFQPYFDEAVEKFNAQQPEPEVAL